MAWVIKARRVAVLAAVFIVGCLCTGVAASSTICQKGHEEIDGACQDCNANGGGRFGGDAGSNFCITCPVGQYENRLLHDGMSEKTVTGFYCTPCPNHYYVDYSYPGLVSGIGGPGGTGGTSQRRTGSTSITYTPISSEESYYFANSIDFCTRCPDNTFNLQYAYKDVMLVLEQEKSIIESYNPPSVDGIALCQPCTANECCLAGEYYDEDAAWETISISHSGSVSYTRPFKTHVEDKQNACKPCPVGTYKDVIGMQACTACPAGKTTTSTGASSVDDCEECPAGREAQPQADGRITCVACTEKKVSVAGGPCEFCPEGLVYMGPGNDKNVNCKLCKACNPHQYRTECADGLEGRCTACESCPDGEQRVNCRHDAGFNDAEGECVKSEFLSYTPFCPTTFEQIDGTDVQVSVGLGGFSYNELFGVPNSSYVADFQCRTECLATDEDTSFCGGPFACGTRACSASFARDGEVDFRKPRGCPVTVDKAGDTDAATLWKIKQTCVDCSVCGQVTPAGLGDLPFAADWGRGCAQECTRLVCEIGEIYDFTDSTCKRCEQLRSKRLCPDTVQDTLRTSDVSGNDVLLRRSGCQEKPGAFDYEERKFYQDTVASPNPEYGDCEECAGPADCAADEYAATCESCERCIPHGLIEMQRRTWSDVDGNDKVLFCQMPECSSGLTGVYGDGRVCTDRCTLLENVQCEDDERVVPCMLPHNVRCRKRWPAHELPRVHRGVAASSADLLNDASEFASFENALVEVQEEPKHRHVCVWNAMDIRDSVARPGGVSRTWRKPADSIDFVYDKTGTKFCAPITHDNLNLSDVSAVEWKRDPLLQDYPLLPLQNTFASTSQYALTNTSASAVAYRRADEIANAESLWMQNAKYYDYVDIPTAPDGLSGDLFLSLDLKQAVRADTAVQFSNDFRTITHPLSVLVTAWVAGLSQQELGMTATLQAETNEGVPLSADAAWIDMSLATFSTPDADCSDWTAFDQKMSVTAGEPRRFAKMMNLMDVAGVLASSEAVCASDVSFAAVHSVTQTYTCADLANGDAECALTDASALSGDTACCECQGLEDGCTDDDAWSEMYSASSQSYTCSDLTSVTDPDELSQICARQHATQGSGNTACCECLTKDCVDDTAWSFKDGPKTIFCSDVTRDQVNDCQFWLEKGAAVDVHCCRCGGGTQSSECESDAEWTVSISTDETQVTCDSIDSNTHCGLPSANTACCACSGGTTCTTNSGWNVDEITNSAVSCSTITESQCDLFDSSDSSKTGTQACCTCGGGSNSAPVDFVDAANYIDNMWISTTCAACRVSTIADPWDDHLFVEDGAVGADNVLTYRSHYHDVAWHGGVLQVLSAFTEGGVGYDVVTVGERHITLLKMNTGNTQVLDQDDDMIDAEQMIQHVAIMPAPVGGAQSLMIQVVDARGRQSTVMYPSTQSLAFQSPISYDRRLAFCARGHEHMWVVQQVNGVFALYLQSDPAASALRLEDRRKQGATKLYGADIELGVVTLATCSISPSAETLDSQTSVVVVPVHNNNTRTLTFRVSSPKFTGDDALTIEAPAFPACKPGIAWVNDAHFLLGIPCQKLLWRGRSAADALTLTPISHEQENFLHAAYFILDGKTWLRVGVHTSDDVADLTAVSLQSRKCAHGFEALKRSPGRADAVLKSTALCGSFCVHDAACKAYEYLADRGTQCWIYTDDVHWNVSVADDEAGVDVCKKSEPSTAAVTRLLQPSNQLIYVSMARNVQRIQQVVGFRKMSSVDDSFTGLLRLPGNQHVPADNMADTLNVDITEAGTSVDLHFAKRSSWEYNDIRHLTLNDVVQAQSVAEQELRVPMFVKQDDTPVQCQLRIQFVRKDTPSYLIPRLNSLGVDIFVVLETAPNVFSINRGELHDETGRERIKWYDHSLAYADQTPVATGHLDVPYGQSVRFLFCDVGLSALALRAYLDGFEYISAVRGLAHYASNGAIGAEAWRRWGHWQRLAVVVPKSLTWKAALVRLAVERTPDAELGSSWPETGCETQLVVGVDAFSALPLLTETPAHKIGDFVFVAALRLQGTHVFDASVQRGSGTTDWKRVHARALAPRAPMFASAASVIRVRVRFLHHFTQSPIPPVADVGLNKLGCDIDLGGGGDGDTVHDSCFLELPYDTIYDSRLVLAFEFVPRDAQTPQHLINLLAANPQNGDVFATPAPAHSSLVECPAADEFWDVDSSVCRPCDVGQTDCQPGEYIPGCTALEVDESNVKLTDCVACTNAPSGQTPPTHFTWDSNSDNKRTCSYTCATDRFKDADGMCQQCTTPTCERGEEVVACTREVDARCALCVPHVEHGVFMQNEDFIDTTHACLDSDECGSCFSQCANGYYRLKTSVTNPVDGASSDITPCVPCKSLQDAQALLEQTRMDDALGTFYRFQACTGITDLIAEQCPVVANGDAIGDATTIGGACAYKCNSGFRVANDVSTTQTVTAYSAAADNTAFETAMHTNKASEAFGTFTVTFEEKTCTACPSPYADSSSFVWLNTELECQHECADGHMLWNQQCRRCAATVCSSGLYVSGVDCDSCTDCADPMTDATLWQWTGAGAVVGDAKSCPWECKDGYFRSGMECVLHTPQPASCGDNFFWQAGTPEFDGACLPCASCEGLSEVSSCTATANAECTPCAVAITDGEEYVGTACSVQCRAGYIRDAQAGGSGECEACGGFECAPGSHLAAAPSHCADCEACSTPKPANAKWIFRCEYACNAGYVLAQVMIPAVDSDASDTADTTEFVCQADQSGSIEVTKSRVAEIRKIICSSKEYLDDNFVCQPCVVATPSAEQEDVTWSWTGRGCRWECLADRLRYVDRLGHVHCLLWGDYQSVIVARSDAWGKRFARVQYVVPHLNPFELGVFVLVLSVAMGVQFLA